MIRGLMFLAFFILFIHVGYLFTSPVIKNTLLEGKMQEISTNHGLKNEKELRRDVGAFILEKGIDADPENVWIQVAEGKVLIGAAYSTSVTFWFYTRQYDLTAASSEGARAKMLRALRPGYHARS